jgi:hypothetical protein
MRRDFIAVLGGIRRFATFMVLGPFLVWLTAFILHIPRLIRIPDAGALAFLFLVVGIFMALGLIPGLLLAFADGLMERWKLSRVVRAAASAVLACPVTAAAVWIFLKDSGLLSNVATEVATAGLFGMIPAAVCSWVAGRHRGGVMSASGT